MRLIGCPCSPGSCAKDCSVVNSRLSSRAAPLEGPAPPAPEEAAAGPAAPKEVAGFPEAGLVPAMPWLPVAPARRTSLTAAELLKAVSGMLAVSPLDGKMPRGKTWLPERVEGTGVVSDRRLLMVASREALEDSGRERFLAAFLGRGREALVPERQSLEGLVPKGASCPEVAEAGCSWGGAAAAVVMQGGGCVADSKGGAARNRLDGF